MSAILMAATMPGPTQGSGASFHGGTDNTGESPKDRIRSAVESPVGPRTMTDERVGPRRGERASRATYSAIWARLVIRNLG